jgi:hexosaminidase
MNLKFSTKIIFCLILILVLSLNIFPQNIHELNLMPFPKEVKVSGDKFRVNRNFSVEISGKPGLRVYHAATRFLRRLDDRTGLFFVQASVTPDSTPPECNVVIIVERPGKLKLGEDESYNLKIAENKILVTAPTDLGAIHSFQTLFQLLSIDSTGYYFPGIEVNDSPRFLWRGLLIDVARHFMPVGVIKRNLDGMAAVKLNVLHLHLTDNQGFRIECKTFPKLHEKGSDGSYYTQVQIKDIIKYADERGIRVYPEFDMPGHTTAWFPGYPELASLPGPYKIEKRFGTMDPTFNPAVEKTYKFLDKFFKEMTALFPDEYFHIGGDENNGVQWNKNEEIQQFKKEKGFTDNEQLQAYFINRVQKILAKYGKKMIGWDEILQKNTPKDVVIQSWRGIDALAKSAKQGYKGILSNGYYIDLMQPASFHYLNDPDPDSLGLTNEEKANILGGEATMWSEWVTKENIDSRIWPRTAAIAERLWSPKNMNDVDNMYKRLDYISYLLEQYGLIHISFQPVMLRRLANNQQIKSLKILIDVIKPLEGYKRANIGKYGGYKLTQYSPYTLIVDAAVADPKPARDFNNLVYKFLKNQNESDADKLKLELKLLSENHKELLPIINNSPMLKEIEPLSSNLSSLALAGLDAISFIESKTVPGGEWKNKADIILGKSQISYGRVQIAIIGGIKDLINEAEQIHLNKN